MFGFINSPWTSVFFHWCRKNNMLKHSDRITPHSLSLSFSVVSESMAISCHTWETVLEFSCQCFSRIGWLVFTKPYPLQGLGLGTVWVSNREHSVCEATVLPTKPPCHPEPHTILAKKCKVDWLEIVKFLKIPCTHSPNSCFPVSCSPENNFSLTFWMNLIQSFYIKQSCSICTLNVCDWLNGVLMSNHC